MKNDLIKQVRPCDGACCRVSPLRAVQRNDGKDCFFRDPALPDRGCAIMRDIRRVQELTKREAIQFERGCLNWPQNCTRETQKTFGNCCWDWADADR